MSLRNNKAAITSGIATGVTAKVTTRLATDVALTANVYDNGVLGVGATLTASVNGILADIDGVTAIVGDRILVKDEVAGLKNGFYDVTSVGSAGSKYVLTRSVDADQNAEVGVNANAFVSEGVENADQIYTLTNDGVITIGTTALTFEVPSASLIKLGVRSSASAFDLQFKSSEALTANHSLSYILGDADRTLSILADVELDQSLKIADSPTFIGATYSGLTASQIVETDGAKALVSVAKATAYNKAFGAIAGTVTEGNDGRLHSSTTSLSEGTNLYYTEARVTANTNVAANTTHRSSDGSDHSFIDQDVTSSGSPVFSAISADTVSEKTLDAGVTVDSMLLKDRKMSGATGTELDLSGVNILAFTTDAGTFNKPYVYLDGSTGLQDFEIANQAGTGGGFPQITINSYAASSNNLIIRRETGAATNLFNDIQMRSADILHRISNTTITTIDANGFTFADAKNIIFNATTGTKIGTATSQKIGFWNATPVVQPSSTGQTAGFTAGVGAAVLDDSTFTGGVGTKAYTMGDVVRHLKTIGQLASS